MSGKGLMKEEVVPFEEDPLEQLKLERRLEIKRMFELLELQGPGVEVQVDGGRWRRFLGFDRCPILGRVTSVVLEDALFSRVSIPLELMTDVRKPKEESE